MNTRTFPRTLDEAFGPYQRSSQCVIEPMPEPRTPRYDVALYIVAVIAVIVIWSVS